MQGHLDAAETLVEALQVGALVGERRRLQLHGHRAHGRVRGAVRQLGRGEDAALPGGAAHLDADARRARVRLAGQAPALGAQLLGDALELALRGRRELARAETHEALAAGAAAGAVGGDVDLGAHEAVEQVLLLVHRERESDGLDEDFRHGLSLGFLAQTLAGPKMSAMRFLRSTTFCMRASQTSLSVVPWCLVEHAGDAEPLALHLAVLAVAVALDVVSGFRVLADDALVVAQDDLARRLADDVVGEHGRLAAAADGVDDVGRHAEPGGVAAQALVDLDALGDAGAEVRRALGEVALVVVVRLHAVLQQLVRELLHDLGAVVDAAHQHRLVAHRDAGVAQAVAGELALGGELLRVVEVGVEVERLVLLQHRDELGRDALRADHRHARAEADDLHVVDGAHAPRGCSRAARR